ncbi:hypothetical protein [Streptomyces noursei]|uniref:hypothetical protein n=1 Tax=Streptomyces noursei TaxID=1971 RepID=UPI0005701BD6|nr:hypothetical protein [Streptomyces noursei]
MRPDGSRQQLRVERATGAPHSGYAPALGLALSALLTSPPTVWPLIEGTRGIRNAARTAGGTGPVGTARAGS